ncbi:MAG: acyl carrier protein [Verrucomicrobiota bacterium]|jgi:acyl carrier protein
MSQPAPMDRDAILAKVRDILAKQFEIPPEKVVPEAQLYTDLGLDSIDAVDLVVTLQDMAGRKVDADRFRSIRSVEQLVDAIYDLLNGK